MVHEHWGVSRFLFRTLICSNHKTLCSIWFAGSSRFLISFWGDVWRYIFYFQSLILNIARFLLSIHQWICAFDSTHILRNAHFMEELILYWPSKFFLPFRQSMPMGEKFRGFKGIWVLCFCRICL